MKNRILTFIIGVLVGAIITTACFIILNKPMNNNNDFNRVPPNGEFSPNKNMDDPPERRNEDVKNI